MRKPKYTGPPGSKFNEEAKTGFFGLVPGMSYQTGPTVDSTNGEPLPKGLTASASYAHPSVKGLSKTQIAAVLLINSHVHEALEWFKVNGKQWRDPHNEAIDELLKARTVDLVKTLGRLR